MEWRFLVIIFAICLFYPSAAVQEKVCTLLRSVSSCGNGFFMEWGALRQAAIFPCDPFENCALLGNFLGNRVLRYIYLESSRKYSTPERFGPGIIMTKRPLDILDQVLNRQPVIVSLKGGREIRGILQGYDVHMNLVLDKAEEVVNGQVQKVGMLIVRGDNVIYISPSVE
jgi:small nuclear ribonucleoprotein